MEEDGVTKTYYVVMKGGDDDVSQGRWHFWPLASPGVLPKGEGFRRSL